MNYKLEKFWNSTVWSSLSGENSMNYKLEKFWNLISSFVKVPDNLWTINLKSFEINSNIYSVINEKDEL